MRVDNKVGGNDVSPTASGENEETHRKDVEWIVRPSTCVDSYQLGWKSINGNMAQNSCKDPCCPCHCNLLAPCPADNLCTSYISVRD